ncbi:MAG: YggS family pyridoxal phosphate-dependent enzyme [Candidatus Hydrogenedentota bacterium]
MKNILKTNLNLLQSRIDAALERANRTPGDARLIPVTKKVDLEEVQALYDLGFRELGENRPHDAEPKINAMPDDICWHMIGSIQRRKTKDVVQLFDRIDSVDRLELATELEKRCAEAARSMEILLQINVSGEDSKHGFTAKVLSDTLNTIQSYEHLRIAGLMTMAPAEASEDEIRGYFRELKHLADDNGLSVLSMGMTNDFEIAIEEGATEIRIGTALYQQAE